MYQVYSIQQPGRPRWAMAASTLLLAAVVTLAAALVHTKQEALLITLASQSQTFPAAHLRVRLPNDWDPIQEGIEKLPDAVVMARPGTPSGEAILIFRPPPRPFAIPSEQAADALRQMLRPLDPGEEIQSEPASVGGLPGWGIWHGSRIKVGGQPLVHSLARVGVAPGGQIVGVLLRLPREPLAEDYLLMDDLCRSVQLTDIQITDDASQIAEDAGIHITAPDDARFVSPATPAAIGLPRLRLFGGDGTSRWFMEVSRIPLIDERTSAEIVEMYATNAAQTRTPPEIAEEHTPSGRVLAQVVLPAQPGRLPRLLVVCARVAKGTGLMIVGWGEPEAEPRLQNLALAIADGAQVRSSEDLLEPPTAKAKASQILANIAREGLTKWWGELSRKQETFTEWAPLSTGGRMLTSRVSENDADNATWWTVTTEYLVPLRPLPGISMESAFAHGTEKWSLPDDGSAHAGRIIRNTDMSGSFTYEYTELRRPGENLVRCELSHHNGESEEWKMPAGETYACDPLLLVAAATLAAEPPGQTALFTASEPFNRHPPWVILTAMGEVDLPNPQSQDRALAVTLVKDYDPSPVTLYHARTGELLAVAFDNGAWRERAEVSPIPARVRSFKARP